MNNRERAIITGLAGVLLAVVLVGLVMWGYPRWNVYSQRLSGEARLAEAESSRQIAVHEAQAKLDSADLLNQAEVLRAQGLAEANRIIGDSLRSNEAYLRYLWIQAIEGQSDGQIIYVPTEAGLPILEAGRLQ